MCQHCCENSAPNLSARTILLVASGGAARRTLLRDLCSTGARIVCYHREISWAKELISDWIVGSLSDNEAAWSAISKYLEENPDIHFDGLLCYDEFAIALASYLGERLQLPYMPYDVVTSVRNKHKFRQTCVANGVAAPKFLHIPNLVDTAIETAFHERGLQFPVVVKPAMGAGSNYVKKVRSMAELRESAAWFQADFQSCREIWGLAENESGGLLVEEYIDGAEVDVDCVVEKGRVLFACVSDNRACEEPFFLEKGGRCPSILPGNQQGELVRLLEDVVGMYGPRLSGCFHFEAKYSPARGAIPIELNLRIGNAETYINVLTAFGVNLIHAAARSCLGQSALPDHVYNPNMQPRTHLASVNFTPSWRGKARLEANDMDPFVAASPNFVGIHFYHQPGTILALPPEGFQSCGWMVAKGDTPEEAEKNLVELIAGVHFRLSAP